MQLRLHLEIILLGLWICSTHAWVNQLPNALSSSYTLSTTTALQARLSPLPPNISPFEKSEAKSRDLTGDFRKTTLVALQQAMKDGKKELEIEFPPLLESKSQFDDFDNVQELNKNRDWCVEWLPTLSNTFGSTGPVWFVLPDTKEVELAKEEWGGQRYRQAASFTSIEAVTEYYFNSGSTAGSGSGDEDQNFSKPWGATFAAGMSQLLGGGNGDSGLLGNLESLDDLTTETNPSLHLVCQPGNGGPVEDWINVKKFHFDLAKATTPTCIVNGALDKVRDGYYNGFIFPALAKTFDFYKSFETIFYLKPVSDKGVYGWLYRVYPEPWQVVLQSPYEKGGRVMVEDHVALVSDKRPTYTEAVQALLQEAQKQQSQKA